jgi:hypothetical protein
VLATRELILFTTIKESLVAKTLPMPEIERLTITLPADMAAVVTGAVEGG